MKFVNEIADEARWWQNVLLKLLNTGSFIFIKQSPAGEILDIKPGVHLIPNQKRQNQKVRVLTRQSKESEVEVNTSVGRFSFNPMLLSICSSMPAVIGRYQHITGYRRALVTVYFRLSTLTDIPDREIFWQRARERQNQVDPLPIDLLDLEEVPTPA